MPYRSAFLALPSIVAFLALGACGDVGSLAAPSGMAPETPSLARQPIRPTGTGIGVIGSVYRARQKVEYHGGSVMLGPTNVYLVWYGSWSGSTAQPILTNLVQNLGGSSYFNAVVRYPDANGVAPSNVIQYSGAILDPYSYGATLANWDVAFIVGTAIIDQRLPLDPNAAYVVLTSADVAETSGFGTDYCGFHSQTSVNGTVVQVIFVGHPDRAPAQCMPQAVSPNGDAAADAMATVLVNELFDTIVDPGFRAWYDKFGLEPADKCAWNFGRTYETANGARANVAIGGRDYLLQQHWVPELRGFCTLDATAVQ